MERIWVLETSKKIGEKVKVAGWVVSKRDHGKISFIDLSDMSGVLQIVCKPELVEGLHIQDVIEVVGEVTERPEKLVNTNLITGTVELQAESIKVLSKAQELPFDMGGKDLDVSLPVLLDYRSLTLRHPKVKSIFKVQETIAQSFRKTLKEEGFTEIFVPTIVPTATEGGSEVFKVSYHGHDAYMAQSPQQYKQMMVGSLERVFTIAHAYRAEPSVTTRHLSEYISLDGEFGFISSYNDIMDVVEKVIKGIFKSVKEQNEKELKLFEVNVPSPENNFPRIKMREAQQIVFERTGRDNRNEPDLEPADEKEICAWAQETNGSPFVFITHYPTKKRPFYTFPDPEDPEYTLSFDLIGIQEEWVTGGQRINNYDQLMEHVLQWKNKPEDFDMYLQAFKYGMPPEGGFALGLERITKDILGLANVREASLYPRDMERIDIRLPKIED